MLWIVITLMLALSFGVWLLVPTGQYGPFSLDYFPLTRVTQFIIGIAIAILIREGWRCPISRPLAVSGVVGWHAVLYVWSELPRGRANGTHILHPRFLSSFRLLS